MRGYVNYGNFLNKLILKKIKSFIALKTLGKPKNFKTPIGKTGCLGNPHFLLTGCLGIQFFDLPPIPTESVKPLLVTYSSLCSTCVTYRGTMPCHGIGHQVLSYPNPYLGKQRISLEVARILSMCL